MAKVLVAYYSRGGATARMAELVAEGARAVRGAQVDLKKAADVDPKGLAAWDAILLGSPTYYGTLAAEVKELLDRSVAIHGALEGKVGGAFTSSGNLAGGNETTLLSILQGLLIHGMVVQGTSEGSHYGPVAVGKPDKRAEQECRDLGRRAAELAVKLHG